MIRRSREYLFRLVRKIKLSMGQLKATLDLILTFDDGKY